MDIPKWTPKGFEDIEIINQAKKKKKKKVRGL